jgi:hypothetical protein
MGRTLNRRQRGQRYVADRHFALRITSGHITPGGPDADCGITTQVKPMYFCSLGSLPDVVAAVIFQTENEPDGQKLQEYGRVLKPLVAT